MKTFLVWNIESELSQELCLELARRGRRLLCVGKDAERLQQLDARLAQAELHRFVAGIEASELPAWVKGENIGLDALILLPDPPPPQERLLGPADAILGQLQAGLVTPLEVLRQLQPLLERGKKPKPVLVLLNRQAHSDASPWEACLKQLWRTCTAQLATEFAPFDLAINLGCVGPLLAPIEDETEPDESAKERAPVIQRIQALPGRAVSTAEGARFAANVLDSVSPALTGQVLELAPRV